MRQSTRDLRHARSQRARAARVATTRRDIRQRQAETAMRLAAPVIARLTADRSATGAAA